MNVLDSECLKLNSLWQPLDIITVKQAIKDAAAGASTLLRFTKDGYPTPYRLEDWLNIPVEDKEEYIGIGGKFHGEVRKMAIPRVQICINYDQLIAEEQNPKNIDHQLRRYNHKDAVTGKDLSKEDASLEHVRPRSKGGDSSWKNVVPMHRKLNSKRGNKSYRKVGLKKPKILVAPKPLLPIHSMVNRFGYSEWDLFHIKRLPN